MMRAPKLLRRWRRRCATLLVEVRRWLRASQADGTPEQIHLLRVTLRRLRLYARLGRPLLLPAALARLRRWSRQVSAVTGPVRDYDVAVEWLQKQPAAQNVIEMLQSRRHKLLASSRAKLAAVPPSLANLLREVDTEHRPARRLKKRLRKREASLQKAVRERMPVFFAAQPAAQHNFRRTLRWWRYLEELTLPKRQPDASPLVKQLVRVQGAIGDQQNRAVTAVLLKRLPPTPGITKLQRLLAEEQELGRRRIRREFKALVRLIARASR